MVGLTFRIYFDFRIFALNKGRCPLGFEGYLVLEALIFWILWQVFECLINSQTISKLILCLIIQSAMEPMKNSKPIINLLVATKLVLYTVLEYLDPCTLKNLYISVKSEADSKYVSLAAVLQSYLYIRLHMINTDRTYYYFVYDNSRFQNIQKLTIAFLVQSNNKFKHLFQLRQHRNYFFIDLLTKADSQQVAHQIEQISNDPQIPMMRLLRETVGIGCSSLFQNYLLSLREKDYSMPTEEYPNLSEFYQKRTNQSYINQFFKIATSHTQHSSYLKIKRLRLASYLITCDQKTDYELADNQMHNLIVGLFALADEMIQASVAYLNGIEDPYYRFLEFCLRYSIYRNFVLSIQDKYAFVFQSYQSIYQGTFKSQNFNIPQFSFWRPAFSKWSLYMSKFHKQCTEVYNHLILKKRLQNMIEFIQNIQELQKPSDYSVVRNCINLVNSEDLSKVDRITNKQIYQLIEQQLDFCINEYVQYQIDLSIDQVSVNWCGHSKQKLEMPFIQFQGQVLQINRGFYEQILKFNFEPATLEKLVQNDLSFILNNNFYKQKIFASIVQSATQCINFASNNLSKFRFQYENLDQRIQFINQKNQIPQQIYDEQSRKFYKIFPVKQEQISKYFEKNTNSTIDQQQIFQVQGNFEHQMSLGDEDSKLKNIQELMQDESQLENQLCGYGQDPEPKVKQKANVCFKKHIK